MKALLSGFGGVLRQISTERRMKRLLLCESRDSREKTNACITPHLAPFTEKLVQCKYVLSAKSLQTRRKKRKKQ
jgi:hypothetical protein